MVFCALIFSFLNFFDQIFWRWFSNALIVRSRSSFCLVNENSLNWTSGLVLLCFFLFQSIWEWRRRGRIEETDRNTFFSIIGSTIAQITTRYILHFTIDFTIGIFASGVLFSSDFVLSENSSRIIVTVEESHGIIIKIR